jgi:hypothetical protein
VGDLKTTTITGAAQNSPVTVHAFQNGTDLGTANTDAQGHFTVSGHATQSSIGDRTDIWSVGGVAVGQVEYEVIPPPTSLRVTNESVTNNSPLCSGNFGIDVDITYKASSAVGDYDTKGDIGSTAGYPTSSRFADGTAVFHDVPVGACANFSFANAGPSQVISMVIGNNFYQVRGATRFVVNGSSSGHGSITNNLDVSASK